MSALSLTGREWILSCPPDGAVDTLLSALDIHPLIAQCLALRVDGASAAKAWLAPSLSALADPLAIHGMDTAIQRLQQAIAAKERIRIVTDYDVDGTTSSLILQATLRILGAGEAIDYHIPDRMNEGYGFSVAAAEKAAADGIGLIITADIGVRDHNSVRAAVKAGVDVIICDHHLPAGADVPADAIAVLCPPQEKCSYPNPALAACGVSLKLAQALLADHPKLPAILNSLLKLAAIGTVADVVDLSTPENRAIVALGLDALRQGPHTPGLQALIDVSGLGPEMTARDLGFRIGPRINAAGRLAKATTIIELVMERDPAAARTQAAALDKLNHKRKSIQDELVAKALAKVSDSVPDFAVLWGAESEGWHRGVVGIVAAKVRDRIHRPVAVVSVAGDEARGSVRSTPAIHAVHALDAAADMLLSHGGHPAAAGFSILAADLPEFAQRLNDFAAASATASAWTPRVLIEAELSGTAIADAEALAHELAKLEPHGKGNPEPLLLVRNTRPVNLQPLGEKHLRMRVGGLDTVWWSGREHTEALRGPVDLVGTLGFNHWQGRSTVRFTVEDARPCSGSEAPTPDP